MENVKGRIWLVEGDKDIRDAMADRIRHQGYSVRELDDPEVTFDILKSLKGTDKVPNLVIASNDFDNGINGIDVADKAKEVNVPVIVMSIHDSIKKNILSKDIIFVAKPYDVLKFDNLIKDIVPLESAKNIISEKKDSETSEDKKNLVLVVGNDPYLIKQMVDELKEEYTVKAFGNTEGAIEYLSKPSNEKPSLIVADQAAGNILNPSGIANKAKKHGVPIIVLSDSLRENKKAPADNVIFIHTDYKEQELSHLAGETIASSENKGRTR